METQRERMKINPMKGLRVTWAPTIYRPRRNETLYSRYKSLANCFDSGPYKSPILASVSFKYLYATAAAAPAEKIRGSCLIERGKTVSASGQTLAAKEVTKIWPEDLYVFFFHQTTNRRGSK